MKPSISIFWLFIWSLLCSLQAWGNPVSTENVTAALLSEHQSVAPGDTAQLLLDLKIRPHWRTYWINPGDSGEPPGIDWTLPPGVEAGPLAFTTPELIRVGPLANYGYSERALHLISLKIPQDWPLGVPIQIQARAHWLVCEAHCIPESANLDLILQVTPQTGAPRADLEPLFAQARAGLPIDADGMSGVRLITEPEGARLSFPLSGLPPGTARTLKSVWFFPAAWGLIEHSADQSWRISEDDQGGRIEVDLIPGVAFEQTAPDGLLVLEGTDGWVVPVSLKPSRMIGSSVESEQEGMSFGVALIFAFIGGLILNLMPCVFPLLAIKALSLAGQGRLSGSQRLLHGLYYTAGILVFFGLLGALLFALRASGAAVGWGFQLQYPPFVAIMAYLFVVLGLSLAGALTLGAGLMGLADHVQVDSASGAGAFMTGALAALVAAPCTAPFMGVALGYAVTLPWLPALAVLLTLGLGLAAPFLLLSLWPGLARKFPKPGPWMETFKQFLAFPLFATAIWLVWVLSVQSGSTGVALVLGGILVLVFGFWVRERTRMGGVFWERLGLIASVLGLGFALWLGFLTAGLGSAGGVSAGQSGPSQDRLSPETYSAARLAQARAQDRPVFVNMTAAWCITCLVNERVALSTDRVANRFTDSNTLYLKGDWTNQDPEITDYLAGFGRNGVPLYVYYPPGGDPRVLPQILTSSMVAEAIEPVEDPGSQSFTEGD